MTTHLQQRARTIRVLSIASVLVISGIAVSQASYSAFSATTRTVATPGPAVRRHSPTTGRPRHSWRRTSIPSIQAPSP